MDYYQVLGVHRDASAHAIKQAFRRLAFQFHPDRNPKNTKRAQERMQMINEAYGVLSDSRKRRLYDEKGAGYTEPVRPQARAQAKIDPEAQRIAEEVLRDMERRLRFGTSRFESKDGMLGMVLAFVGIATLPTSEEKFPMAVGFMAICVALGLFTRAATRATMRDVFSANSETFIAAVLANAAAAFAMFSLVKSGGQKWSVEFLRFGSSTVLTVLIPSMMGAAFGRAFNSALGTLAGIIGGVVVGGLVVFPFSMWLVVLQSTNEEMSKSGVVESFKIVMICTVVASAIGSLRMQSFGLFSILDFFESFFERFSGTPVTRAVVVVKKK